MLKVRNKASEENTYVFELPSKDACKYLWKCCIEHHAFFRLTQVKDISGLPINIFRLGSKHRFSGRTEQQIKTEMKRIKRPPPTVVRVPSRRYPKRLGEPDGAEDEKQIVEQLVKSNAKDDLSLPQKDASCPLYRSVSTPAELPNTDISKSTKNAPWEDPEQKGLFTNSSRQSLCSSHGSEKRHNHRSHSRRRSPSGDSEISTDHKSKRHRCKRSSDNDSDVSKSSKGSKSSHASSHRKTRHHSRDTGSDTDSQPKRRNRKQRSHGGGVKYELISSEDQWKLAQKVQENNNGPQNAVVRDLSNRKSGYLNSGVDTESEVTAHHHKKPKRHSRSRSRSPTSKQAILNEVKKHIRYNLIDPTTLTEEEKKDIKYTKIETETDVIKVHYSPVSSGSPRYKVAKVPPKPSTEMTDSKMSIERSASRSPSRPKSCEINANSAQKKHDYGLQRKHNHRRDQNHIATSYISDSSCSSVSSAIKTRKNCGVTPGSSLSHHKVRVLKHLHANSPCSSETDTSSVCNRVSSSNKHGITRASRSNQVHQPRPHSTHR